MKSNAEDDPTWGILGMEQATSTRRVRTLDVGSAVRSLIADTDPEILLRQNKCLDNLAEQDRRAVKRITRPMMGGKSFRCARAIIAGIETMHMIRNCQWQTLKPKPRPKPTSSTAWMFLRPVVASAVLPRLLDVIATGPFIETLSALEIAALKLGSTLGSGIRDGQKRKGFAL